MENKMTLKLMLEMMDIAKIEDFLCDSGTNVSQEELDEALSSAAFYGDKEAVEMFIRYGANVNILQANHMTPLSCAIESMNVEIIEFLLENGADINACNEFGVTPLHHAIDIEIEEALSVEEYPPSARITSLLLSHNPNVNAKDFNGRTALDWAITRQHTLAIELLSV